jgi:hypothetical protein
MPCTKSLAGLDYIGGLVDLNLRAAVDVSMSNLFTLTVVQQETQEIMQHWTNLSAEDVNFARGLLIPSATAARPDWRILLVRSTGSTQTLLEGKNYERDSNPIDAEDLNSSFFSCEQRTTGLPG